METLRTGVGTSLFSLLTVSAPPCQEDIGSDDDSVPLQDAGECSPSWGLWRGAW